MSVEVLSRRLGVYTVGFQAFWPVICFTLGPSVFEAEVSYSFYVWCSLFLILSPSYYVNFMFNTDLKGSKMRPHFAFLNSVLRGHFCGLYLLGHMLEWIVQKVLCLLFSKFTASDSRQCLGRCVSGENLLGEKLQRKVIPAHFTG